MSEEQNIPQEETPDNSPQSTDEHKNVPELPTTNPVLPGHPGGHKLQTPSMEVHHHGHVHEKKKWKEYLFQFFMLFLAVFCGFLAEYQLEHIVEHNREEQYIKSFIEDLKADTVKINEVIQVSEWQHPTFDSLMGVIKQPGFIDSPAVVGNYISSIFVLSLFNNTDRTLQQLKNAGGLRLIRKQAASDSIMQYDDRIKLVEEQAKDVYNSNQVCIGLGLQIFDGNSWDNPGINRSLVPKPVKAKLISNDAAKLDEFFNRVLNFKIASLIYSEKLLDLKAYAARQIIFLKDEYDFK